MSSITDLSTYRDPSRMGTRQLEDRVDQFGKCSNRPADPVFFPNRTITSKAAREACAGCPVMRECLEATLRREARIPGRPEGIFGGRSPGWRYRRLQEQRRLAVAS